MDAAARAYVANALQGVHTRLIAMDWARCRELSRRVRDDLKHLGIVSDGPAVELAEGAEASVGDLIVSRKVDHDAGLANGDVLRVESIEHGRAVLRKVVDRDKETGGTVLADGTLTYADFSEFNLAYAVTGHAAQGDTVTEGIAYVTGHEPRNWLYVAMSRGARTNHAFVTTRPETADVSPGTVAAPELARHKRVERLRAGAIPGKGKASESDRHHIGVLADVLSRDGGEDSASEILRRNLANADHLGILHTVLAVRDDRRPEERVHRDGPRAAARRAPGGRERTDRRVAVPDTSPGRDLRPGPSPAPDPGHRRGRPEQCQGRCLGPEPPDLGLHRGHGHGQAAVGRAGARRR